MQLVRIWGPRFALVVLVGLASMGRAADRILTFGGGPAPDHNQASLEKNVLYFQHVLAALGLGAVRHDIYFADGSTKSRTVEYQPAANAGDQQSGLLTSIFSNDGNAGLRFRPAEIPGLAGPSTPASINSWFNGAARTLSASDHLMIYFTGHGGQLNANNTRNTVLYTWNKTSMSVHDFVTQLDKLNPAVDVTLVMVQCHSGGFANVIYNQGDPARGLSKYHRCGFFSTIATRQAAGCTPDINEEDYHEFSTSFFEALSGKSRTGKKVERPDYDHDGTTSFTDAFMYVLLTSDTIDIPMTTSDQFLLDNSRLHSRKVPNLLTMDAAYSTILALATPAQKAALEGLAAQLKLTGDDRVAAARKLARNLDDQRKIVQGEEHADETAAKEARQQIKQTLHLRWPDLDKPGHPKTAAFIASHEAQVQEAIENSPSYKALVSAQQKQGDAEENDMTLERQWVKTQRFINRAQAVVLAANLGKVATPETVSAYKDLIALENRTLNALGIGAAALNQR